MRNNALLPPAPFQPCGLTLKPLERMKRTTDLEGADALQVLALEPQPDDRRRGLPAFPPRSREFSLGPWRRREGCQRPVRDYGRPVDVWRDELVGLLDGGAG